MGCFPPIESRLHRQGYLLIAGIDEAGRGPLAGPVVSAAVILKKGTKIEGLKDSKLLSAKKRLELFNIIIDQCLDYSICMVPHTLIDEINILNSVRVANDLCVRSLKNKPDIILIDGRDKQILKDPFYTMIKGESKSAAIAAASILAKVSRDMVMHYYDQQYPEYAFDVHMGYGTRKHRELIHKHGFCDIHRKSYTLKALN